MKKTKPKPATVGERIALQHCQRLYLVTPPLAYIRQASLWDDERKLARAIDRALKTERRKWEREQAATRQQIADDDAAAEAGV